MHLSGYAVERKGLRNGIAELLQTCRSGADRQKGHRDYRWLRQCRSAMTAKKKPGEYKQRMLHLYMIG